MAPDVAGFLFARLPLFASIWATPSVHEDKAVIHTHTQTAAVSLVKCVINDLDFRAGRGFISLTSLTLSFELERFSH